jgi:hypothetical protein
MFLNLESFWWRSTQSPPTTEHPPIQGHRPQHKKKTNSKKSTTRNTKLNNEKRDDHNHTELHIQKHGTQQQKNEKTTHTTA